MFTYSRLIVVFALFVFAVVVRAEGLTLQQAEQLALQNDPQSKRFDSMAKAMDERSVSSQQLPDPKLVFGLMNYPTDTFSRTQEPMTQIQLGFRQAFPRGDTLRYRSEKDRIKADSFRELQNNRARMTIKSVRQAWLDLYYWQKAEQVVLKNRKLFQQMLEVAQYQYGAGKRNQQDVIRAQLELSRIEDRITRIRTMRDKARAELVRWVGAAVSTDRLEGGLIYQANLPELGVLEERLKQHPSLKVKMAKVDEMRKGVALAREAYKPGWALGVTYGIRDGNNANGSERADFVSAMVTLDVPLFKKNRQDRRLKASQYQLSAAQHERDNQYLELSRMLQRDYAQWQRLMERARHYQKVLLPQAKQNAEVSLRAYQNDRTDFSTLMRARITQLNLVLDAIRLEVDLSRTIASLRYLAGEKL
jgi:outer membrane protein TolC